MQGSTKRVLRTSEYCVLSGFILLIYCVFCRVAEGVTDGALFGKNVNLVSYILMMVLACLLIGVFLLVSAWLNKRDRAISTGTERTSRMEYALAGVIILCAVVFFYLIYCYEGTIFPQGSHGGKLRTYIFRPIYSLFMCGAFGLFLFFSRNGRETKQKARMFACVFFALICAACTYAPNPFSDGSGGMHHIHAYINSIVNVANLQPYDQYMMSIYGHYGLIYLPFVKLLGNNYTAVALSISLFTLVTYYCLFEVCNQWIKKDSVFFTAILGIMAVPLMIYRSGQFYQVNPHRLLLPALSLCMITRMIRKDKPSKWEWFWEGIVGTLGVIWNFETGVFTVAVFCAFNLFRVLSDRPTVKKVLGVIIKDVVMAIICVGGAYLLVNGYSFLTGYKHWLKPVEFTYPIGNKSGYRVANLRTEFVATPFCIFVLQMVIFSAVLLNVGHALCSKDTPQAYKQSRLMLLCIALSGLSAVIYYVNRQAYANISISWVQMVMVLAFFGDEGLSESIRAKEQGRIAHVGRTAGKIVALLYVFVFAVESGLCLDSALQNRASTTWNTTRFEDLAEEGKEEFPEDVLAMGVGIPELFSQMGRTDFPSLIDFSDMNGINMEKAMMLMDEAGQQGKPFLLGSDTESLKQHALDLGYGTIWEYTLGKVNFQLMYPGGKKK